MAVFFGCQQDVPYSARANRILDNPAAHIAEVGGNIAQPDTLSLLAVVIGARVLETQRQIAVLDASPPYLKMFSWDGRFARAFIPKGGGPGEALFPIAVGSAGDSVLLVADADGRVQSFDTSGRIIAQGTTTGFRIMAVDRGCNGDWLLYGPSPSHAPDHQLAWLHALSTDLKDVKDVPEFFEPLQSGDQFAFGKAQGLVWSGNRAIVRHTYGPSPRVLGWACGSAAPDSLFPLAHPSESKRRSKEAVQSLTLDADESAPMGMAILRDGTIVLADLRLDRDGDLATVFTLLRRGAEATSVRVKGDYSIRDSRPGIGVLFETSSPTPRVFLMVEDSVAAFFGIGVARQ